MTKLLMVSALFSIAASAQAAPTVLAKTVTAGGMPQPGVSCQSRETTVYSDGRVVTSECGKKEVVQLTLGKSRTALLVSFLQTSDLDSGTMEPEDSTQPRCADAPSTMISIITPKGAKEIGGKVDCREVSLRWNDRMMHSEQLALNFLRAVNAVVNAPYGD